MLCGIAFKPVTCSETDTARVCVGTDVVYRNRQGYVVKYISNKVFSVVHKHRYVVTQIVRHSKTHKRCHVDMYISNFNPSTDPIAFINSHNCRNNKKMLLIISFYGTGGKTLSVVGTKHLILGYNNSSAKEWYTFSFLRTPKKRKGVPIFVLKNVKEYHLLYNGKTVGAV
jgi:hypothetical protein